MRLAKLFPVGRDDLDRVADGVRVGQGQVAGRLIGHLITWRGGQLAWIEFNLTTVDGERTVTTWQWLPRMWFEDPDAQRRIPARPLDTVPRGVAPRIWKPIPPYASGGSPDAFCSANPTPFPLPE
ncbi:hypothetical protein [Amycolatopsis sp. CA-230715]|uniref:hypothetical protein n=1 Tax=Amycolatopsis sp. CA-230715 TaxID=2745196 RepID=UPI001C0323E1|nr:hypothetical protein [Amycolatopsis sp. CA-230715]